MLQGNLRGGEAGGPQEDRGGVCCQVSACAEQHPDQSLPGEGPAVPPGSPQSRLPAGLLLHQTHPGVDHGDVSSPPGETWVGTRVVFVHFRVL